MVGWKVGVVAESRSETPSGRSIILEVPGWGGNIAGQHLDARVTAPDGYQAVRAYSIATSGDGDRIQLGVDRVQGGEVSPYLVDDLQVGDALEVKGPLGGWFVWKPEHTQSVQLIGGGSGVVPLMAMIRSHRATQSAVPFRLLYSARSEEHTFFRDELAQSSPALDVTLLYTRQAPDGWPRAAGRVTKEDLVATTFPADISPSVFVCGPTPFVEAVASTLVELGHHPLMVKTERFGG
ncbi:MAG TPA: ferredoxin reductase [Glaciibacter sp.]|nr:ferredoxin reductase [Glaciibacter sp.]